MTDLAAIKDVRRVLRPLWDQAAYDAAHLEPGPGIGRLEHRFDVYDKCMTLLDVLEHEPDFALVLSNAAEAVHERSLPAAQPEPVDGSGGRHAQTFDDAVAFWDGEAVRLEPKTARAFAAVAEMIQATPDVWTTRWSIEGGRVETSVVAHDVAERRSTLIMLGERLGFAYGEREQGSYTTLRAAGEIEGVEVEFVSATLTSDMAAAGPTPHWKDLPARDDQTGADRRFRNLLLAAGLHERIGDVHFWWNVDSERVKAMLPHDDDRLTRAVLPVLARRLGLSYTEVKAPTHGASKVKALVSGTLDGVPVELWNICDQLPAVPATADNDTSSLSIGGIAAALEGQPDVPFRKLVATADGSVTAVESVVAA